MRVEGSTALSWRRGRYARLRTRKGPRPLPIRFGPSSVTLDDVIAGGLRQDFRCIPRLHSFDEAYLVMGHGDDGAVITSGLELVGELCVFSQLGQKPRPMVLDHKIRDETLENVAVGVDGSSQNYYHWIINALGRARLCASLVPGATIVLPDYRQAPDQPGRVTSAVRRASAEALLARRPHRLLAPGVYRVRGLHALWTRPTAPTDIADLEDLYHGYDEVAQAVAGTAGRPRRRLYFSRRGAHDGRIPVADLDALHRLLARHGFETVDLAMLSFEAQVRAAAQAEIIVAPHGAGLTNLVFSPRETVVIELTSPVGSETNMRPWFYQLCCGRGQRYGAIHVGHPGWLDDLGVAISRCLR